MIRAALFALAVVLAAPATALSAQAPQPGVADARIRTVAYDPDQVVELKGVFDYQMMLEFAAEEHIENVALGDGLGWQVTPNKRANLLFVKPVDAAMPTNMTVVTDRRRYAFRLTARGVQGLKPEAIAYIVRFLYPHEAKESPVAPPPPATPERKNVAYTYSGSSAVLPSVVFDDGVFTYFKWPDSLATPALFLQGADGTESLVNYAVRNGFLIVEQTGPRFVLRNGKDVTVIINDGWRTPAPDPDAPKPHDARTAGRNPQAGGGQ